MNLLLPFCRKISDLVGNITRFSIFIEVLHFAITVIITISSVVANQMGNLKIPFAKIRP